MKMRSVSLASIFANGCRNFCAPEAVMRTLALAPVSLREQHNKLVQRTWSSRSPNRRTFTCESAKPDISRTSSASCVNGYLKSSKFITYITRLAFLDFGLSCLTVDVLLNHSKVFLLVVWLLRVVISEQNWKFHVFTAKMLLGVYNFGFSLWKYMVTCFNFKNLYRQY